MSNQNRYRNRGKVDRSHPYGGWLKTQLVLSFVLFGLVTLWLLFPLKPSLVEDYYAQTIFPFISQFIVPLNSLIAFPLALVVLGLIILIAITNLIRAIIFGGFIRWLVGSIFMLSIVACWFLISWGANYQRLPVTDLLKLDAIQAEEQQMQLENLANYLLDIIELDQSQIGDYRDNQRAIQAISDSLTKVLEQQNINPPKLADDVKYWPKGSLLKGFSASGVMLPWFIEPTVDAGLPDSEVVAIAAHELAHAAGFATEGDADFIGTLAALSSDSPYGRYSAALRSYRLISSDLPKDLKSQLDLRLPEIAKADWNDTYYAYLQYQAPKWLEQSNETIYDSYLQSQGIEEGIRDYSRSTQLLIQAMQKGLLP